MTIREILAQGKALLETPSPSSRIDTAALDATLLLSETLGKSREGLILHENAPVAAAQREQYFRLLDRRRNGECIAYILGRREFRGLEFTVNPQVLVPRPDTETLVEAVLEYLSLEYLSQRREDHAKDAKDVRNSFAFSAPPLRLCESKIETTISLLDLCTGSGALAISLKNECPYLSVTASDISAAALETARLNAERLLDGGLKAIEFIESDLFENIPGKFDIIVSNPPYVPSGEIAALAPEVRREPPLALDGGADGLELIRKIVAQAVGHLSPGGAFLLEADPQQMAAIAGLLEAHGFGGISVRKDLAGRERVIFGLFQ